MAMNKESIKTYELTSTLPAFSFGIPISSTKN